MTPFDEEILVGFFEEATDYLPAIRKGLAEFRRTPTAPDVLEEAHRLVHTIKGASAMVGLAEFSHVAYHLEEVLERLAHEPDSGTPELLAGMERVVDDIETFLTRSREDGFRVDEWAATAADRVRTLVTGPFAVPPASTVGPDSPGLDASFDFLPLPPGAARVLAIGASTGGPAAIRELLCGLPSDFPAGIVIVQHLPAAFTRPLAEQLSRSTPFPAREAADGDPVEPGVALVAPGDRHLEFAADGRVELGTGSKVSGHRPSVDVAFRSAAKVYGKRSVGVLLTGMGEDGARGLADLRAAGATTFAQDAATCAVYGMPLRAVQLGAAGAVDSPAGIAARLLSCFAGDVR